MFASGAVLPHMSCAPIQHNMPPHLALLTLPLHVPPGRCLPWAYHSFIDRCSTICAAPLPSDALNKLCGGSCVHGTTNIQVLGFRFEPHPTGAPRGTQRQRLP